MVVLRSDSTRLVIPAIVVNVYYRHRHHRYHIRLRYHQVIKTTFYNANLNFFMALTFIFEFTRGGTVVPTTRTGMVKSATLANATSSELMIEFTVILFVFYYIWVQVPQPAHQPPDDHS